MQSWRESPYGDVVKFCNTRTLDRVREVWRLYTTSGLSEQDKRGRQKELTAAIERAKATKKKMANNVTPLSGVRSAAPMGVQMYMSSDDRYQRYWTNGTLDEKATNLVPNPAILLDAHRTMTVHYGTDPLLGFHLATAFLPLASTSKSRVDDPTVSSHVCSHLSKTIQAAQAEFFQWLNKFKAFPKEKLTVRCVVADALAYGHTLQHAGAHPGQTSGNWPADYWTFQQLELDDEEYLGADKPAPVAFDVIDTSNLSDHLGATNLITAYAPLLLSTTSSTLYTETLVSHKAGPEERFKDLLCGDFDSVSLLLGLVNVETWTNATVVSDSDEGMVQKSLKSMGKENADGSTQIRTRLAWRLLTQLTGVVPMTITPVDLVALSMKFYNNMFRHENITNGMQNVLKLGASQLSNPLYNRASFVAFLKHVRSNVNTDWHEFTNKLYDAVVTDRDSFIGTSYFQDLFTQMHLQGVYSVDILVKPPARVTPGRSPARLHDLKNLPNVICITV